VGVLLEEGHEEGTAIILSLMEALEAAMNLNSSRAAANSAEDSVAAQEAVGVEWASSMADVVKEEEDINFSPIEKEDKNRGEFLGFYEIYKIYLRINF
jgi:hypothetical protein